MSTSESDLLSPFVEGGKDVGFSLQHLTVQSGPAVSICMPVQFKVTTIITDRPGSYTNKAKSR